MRTISVCGDCPLYLLERLIDANNTLNAGKASALMAEYTEKMENIMDRAQAVNVRIICDEFTDYIYLVVKDKL